MSSHLWNPFRKSLPTTSNNKMSQLKLWKRAQIYHQALLSKSFWPRVGAREKVFRFHRGKRWTGRPGMRLFTKKPILTSSRIRAMETRSFIPPKAPSLRGFRKEMAMIWDTSITLRMKGRSLGVGSARTWISKLTWLRSLKFKILKFWKPRWLSKMGQEWLAISGNLHKIQDRRKWLNKNRPKNKKMAMKGSQTS